MSRKPRPAEVAFLLARTAESIRRRRWAPLRDEDSDASLLSHLREASSDRPGYSNGPVVDAGIKALCRHLGFLYRDELFAWETAPRRCRKDLLEVLDETAVELRG